jgi:hypothetical protein
MRKCAFFWMVLVILALQVGLLTPAQAEVVGSITQVEGRVDVLKGGKLPANPAKLQDKVESGDVLRTKSLSKAQITFIDNSVITLSPESRLAVDDYQFNPAQEKRSAVVNLFQGMAHVVVNKLFKVDQPDFVIKTATAVTGVRGTDFGVRIQPNAATILNFQGVTQVANIYPEVSELSRRAFKAAYAFGPPGSPGSVLLKDMQGTTVARGLPPTLPFSITGEDRKQFMNQLSYGVTLHKKEQGSGSAGGGGGAGGGSGSALTSNLGVTDTALGTASSTSTISSVLGVIPPPTAIVDNFPNVIIQTPPDVPPPPPVVPPAPPTPPAPTGYSFSQTFAGPYLLTSTSPFTIGIFTSSGPGSGARTGIYAGTFTANYNWSAQWVNPSFTWSTSTPGNFTATMSGLVNGILGQPLAGTMTSVFTDSVGGQFSLTGPVTILPTGELFSTFTGTGVAYPNLDQIIVTGGTITQTPTTGQVAVATAASSTTSVAAAMKPMVSAPVISPATLTIRPVITPTQLAAVAPKVTPAVAPKVLPAVRPVAISPTIALAK